jgi:limonene-1,2-epoxide hydrolase
VTPEEVVRAQFAGWNRLDVDGIVECYTDDAVWENVPIGAVKGREELRAAVHGWISRSDWVDIEILNLAAAGDIVLVERVDHFVFEGQRHDARCMGAFELRGDKIAAWRDYFDMGPGRRARDAFRDKPYPT